MKRKIKELINKYEIKRNVILEVIQIAETKEEVDKEMAVERFIKEFIADLKLINP